MGGGGGVLYSLLRTKGEHPKVYYTRRGTLVISRVIRTLNWRIRILAKVVSPLTIFRAASGGLPLVEGVGLRPSTLSSKPCTLEPQNPTPYLNPKPQTPN